MKITKSNLTLAKALPWILIVVGIIGLIGSFVLTYDKLQLSANPNFVPNCNINPVVSCGSVMESKAGSAFGFPNSFIGLAAYAIFITIGMAMLAGAKFKRWFWLGLQGGSTFALLFVHWLFYHSVYVINALCPYCISVWVVTIASFLYITFYNVDQGYITIPKKFQKIYAWKRRHHLDILVLWLLIIGGLILKHFWYYYGHSF